MSGHKKFSELRSKANPERVAEHRNVMDRELTLAELRKAREMTQAQLARSLDSTQSGVSQLEHRTDIYVSTLRSYVEALGGKLEVVAVFPDATVTLKNFAELAEPAEELVHA